jgi:hypothetical protein
MDDVDRSRAQLLKASGLDDDASVHKHNHKTMIRTVLRRMAWPALVPSRRFCLPRKTVKKNKIKKEA